MRRNTQDKEAPGPPLQSILTNEQIGLKRRLTPEGFLLCEAVPVARVGWMMYAQGESPIKVGPEGYAMVGRTADTLFHPNTIASFLGKPVTNEHPPLGVDPENWSHVCCGTVLNVRQGHGDDADVLLADLLITSADAIRAVQSGKREVSAGYDADYETTSPGEGRQLNIIGNHVALVERGRCGPRCAIGDSLPTSLKGIPMPTANQPRPRKRAVVTDAVRAAINAAVADVLADPVLMNGNEDGDSPDGNDTSHVHVHLHTAPGSPTDAPDAAERANGIDPADLDETDDDAEGPSAGEKNTGDPYEPRFAALEKGHKELHAKLDTLIGSKAPASKPGAGDKPGEQKKEDDDAFAMDEDGDDIEGENDQTDDSVVDLPAGQTPTTPEDTDGQMGVKTGDSAALLTAYQSVIADAEVLVPGFKVPTFDAKAGRKVTIDSMCQLRRKALKGYAGTTDGATTVKILAGGTADLGKMSCKQTALLFRAAAGMKRLSNNRSATGDAGRPPTDTSKPAPRVQTIAELNALHRSIHKH